MEKLTKKQIDAKALELSKKLDCKVISMVIDNEEVGQVVGYFQQPSYDVIMSFIDCYHAGQISKASDFGMKDCLLVDESDSRIMSTDRKNSKIRAGFAYKVTNFIMPYTETYSKMSEETKKKSEAVSSSVQKHS